MDRRAQSADRTRQDILRAAFELSGEKLSLEIVLTEVAARAGTTVQTILRHFGSRQGLFHDVVEFGKREILAEREAPVGDIGAAIEVLYAHYEARGDAVIRWLGQESESPNVAEVLASGRRAHRDWVERVVAPDLESVQNRRPLVDLLVVATDVYTWKLLRRDMGLEISVARERVEQLVRAVLAQPER